MDDQLWSSCSTLSEGQNSIHTQTLFTFPERLLCIFSSKAGRRTRYDIIVVVVLVALCRRARATKGMDWKPIIVIPRAGWNPANDAKCGMVPYVRHRDVGARKPLLIRFYFYIVLLREEGERDECGMRGLLSEYRAVSYTTQFNVVFTVARMPWSHCIHCHITNIVFDVICTLSIDVPTMEHSQRVGDVLPAELHVFSIFFSCSSCFYMNSSLKSSPGFKILLKP